MSDTASQTDFFGIPAEICTVEKDPDKSGLEEMEDTYYRRYCERHYQVVEHVSFMGLPKPGEQMRIVTRRVFNSVHFLERIARKEKILDLKLAIYSINYYAALLLVQLINQGYIGKAEILMSNLRNKAHREKEEIIKKLFVDHPKIDIFYCSSHAKTFSCHTEDGNYYTLEGSGNMANNSRLEQYVLDNSQDMYNFSCQWMREIRQYLRKKNSLNSKNFPAPTPNPPAINPAKTTVYRLFTTAHHVCVAVSNDDGDVIWERGEKMWRFRANYDSPGRQQD